MKPDEALERAIVSLSRAIEELREQLRHMETTAILQGMDRKLDKIVMTQAELSVALDKLTAQVGKVAKEQSDRFDALSAEIKRLTDIINAGGDVTAEVTAALGNVQTALNSLDDAIPDAPTP